VLGLDAWTLVAAAAIVLLGGTVSGVTGFGFGLVIIPILLTIFPPTTVVAVNRVLGFVTGVVILGQDHGHVERGVVARLIPWSTIGLVGGVAVLTRVDATVIRLLAGAVVIVFATLATANCPIPGIGSRYAPAVAGAASGLMGTSIGMSGPPVVLLLTSRALSPLVFRATITGYFVVLDVIAITLLISAGAFGWEEARISAVLLPFALVGRSIGRVVGTRVERERFRRLTLGLLILTGLSAVATALLSL